MAHMPQTQVPPDQLEIMNDLEPVVAALLSSHESKRRLWWPTDLLGAHDSDDPDRVFNELRERARGIPDPVRISLVMGLITEEGLPHFHRLISSTLDHDTYWAKWTDLWTAEEDRHGAAIHNYLWEARIVHPRVVEQLQFEYIRGGYAPPWEGHPFRLLAYTSLQERATQAAHANNAKAGAEYDPTLGTLLDRIATEEARHFHFYRSVFSEVLARDPDAGLIAAAHTIQHFEMPGNPMPGYREMTDVIRRAGLYGPRDFLGIVEEQIGWWNIATRSPRTPEGRKAQEAIMKYPKRLERIIGHMESKARAKSYSFELIFDREFTVT